MARSIILKGIIFKHSTEYTHKLFEVHKMFSAIVQYHSNHSEYDFAGP